jgi:hypothetical protein
MEKKNTLSKEAKAKQQVCLKAASSLITKGLPITIQLLPKDDYITVNLFCHGEESFNAMLEVEKDLRITKGIWFDTGMDSEGVRDWSLDWCLEDKVEA